MLTRKDKTRVNLGTCDVKALITMEIQTGEKEGKKRLGKEGEGREKKRSNHVPGIAILNNRRSDNRFLSHSGARICAAEETARPACECVFFSFFFFFRGQR